MRPGPIQADGGGGGVADALGGRQPPGSLSRPRAIPDQRLARTKMAREPAISVVRMGRFTPGSVLWPSALYRMKVMRGNKLTPTSRTKEKTGIPTALSATSASSARFPYWALYAR